MKNIIQLDNVWKIYHIGDVRVEALRGLNFSVHEGEFVAVQGPSGSGKSTAFNLIGCLDIPTKGSAYLDGKNIAHLSENTLAKLRGKKIGFVFQSFNLVPNLTALENVTMPMLFQNTPEAARTKKAQELLTSVGLSHRMDHRPNQLSGGEKQRVAIARSLANDPDVLLADEPTGNLDSKNGATIIQLLQNLHKEHHKTIVMVTHEKEVAHYAERVIYIKDGKVAA